MIMAIIIVVAAAAAVVVVVVMALKSSTGDFFLTIFSLRRELSSTRTFEYPGHNRV